MSDFGAYMFILGLIIFCAGEPDLLDGLIKQANQVECSQPTEELGE